MDATQWPQLTVPPAWQSVDFISDLHLHASEPETFLAWRDYMQQTRAQAVFILGDLFEVWVGDDAVTDARVRPSEDGNFEVACADILSRAAQRLDLFFMRGNRDFLVGEAFTRACGVRLLNDPCVLLFSGQSWLLSHGDALCLADTEYMQFRSVVRSPGWQQEFLAQPLTQRRAVARELRTRSEARKRTQTGWFDVDCAEAAAWLRASRTSCLIHGHTHHPADHALGVGLQRLVLSDWDLRAAAPRAQVLRLSTPAQGGASVRVERLAPAFA